MPVCSWLTLLTCGQPIPWMRNASEVLRGSHACSEVSNAGFRADAVHERRRAWYTRHSPTAAALALPPGGCPASPLAGRDPVHARLGEGKAGAAGSHRASKKMARGLGPAGVTLCNIKKGVKRTLQGRTLLMDGPAPGSRRDFAGRGPFNAAGRCSFSSAPSFPVWGGGFPSTLHPPSRPLFLSAGVPPLRCVEPECGVVVNRPFLRPRC